MQDVSLMRPPAVPAPAAHIGKIFRKAWGETLIVNVSIGFFMGVIGVLGTLVMLVPLMVTGKLLFLLLGIAGIIVFLVCLSIVSASLYAIFKVVLYMYAATGQVPAGFEPGLIAGAMKKA